MVTPARRPAARQQRGHAGDVVLSSLPPLPRHEHAVDPLRVETGIALTSVRSTCAARSSGRTSARRRRACHRRPDRVQTNTSSVVLVIWSPPGAQHVQLLLVGFGAAQLGRDGQLPTGRLVRLLDGHTRVQAGQGCSSVSGSGSRIPRSVMTVLGPAPRRPSFSWSPGPLPNLTEGRSPRAPRTPWRSGARPRSPPGSSPRSPARHPRLAAAPWFPVVTDHGRVDAGEAVDLGGTEEADVDPPRLEPVVEDLDHAHDGVGGVCQDPVTDRQRQRSGFDPSVPDSYTSTRLGACVVLARFAAVLGSPMPTRQVIPSRRCLAAATVIISSADQLAVLELTALTDPLHTCSWSQRSNASCPC